jgi:hypothetical protein
MSPFHNSTTPSYSAVYLGKANPFVRRRHDTFALSEKPDEQSFHGPTHAGSSEEQSHVCG